MEEPKPQLLSRHFSHEHPLEYTNLPPRKNSTCYGCNLTISPGNYYYKCKTCPFDLHKICHNMPEKINHPSDPNHYLTLQSIPNYSSSNSKAISSIKSCKACGHDLTGLYYDCSKCGHFYHILCSAVPLSIKTPTHQHTLNLEYAPPYDFQCDICEKPSSKSGWLYRCSLCEFDVHLACAIITNKGPELLHHETVPKSPQNSNIKYKGQELMELLIRGLTKAGTEENMEGKIEESDPLSPFREDHSFISYQFSDACFSIDFAKSILGSDDEVITVVIEGANKHLSLELPEVKAEKSPQKIRNCCCI